MITGLGLTKQVPVDDDRIRIFGRNDDGSSACTPSLVRDAASATRKQVQQLLFNGLGATQGATALAEEELG